MHPEKTSAHNLEDVKVNVKIKLSALWASVTLCYLYGDYFELYVPGKTEGLINGVNLLNSPLKLWAAAVLLAIPAIMVFLSVVLRSTINRPVNIIIGLFYTVLMILIAFTSMTPWRSFYVFLALVESGITAIIVYAAWKWPKTNQ